MKVSKKKSAENSKKQKEILGVKRTDKQLQAPALPIRNQIVVETEDNILDFSDPNHRELLVKLLPSIISGLRKHHGQKGGDVEQKMAAGIAADCLDVYVETMDKVEKGEFN